MRESCYKMDGQVRSKRIAFMIGSMRRGGAERVISILANNYAKKGWDVDILTLLDESNDYLLDSSINVTPICNEKKSRMKQLPIWIINIRKYVLENNPDIIVSFIARVNIVTILSCFGLKQRIIVSERNDPREDGRSIIVRFATRLLYPLANCIVFQTKWAQSCFSKKIRKKSVIIVNPIYITTEASSMKEKKIVAVGRLLEQKNHAMLIYAFRKVLDKYSDYKLYIYGEGKLRSILTKQIKDLKLTEAAFLPGNVLNIHEKIADAEMFVLSSNYEGLSNALLEAMLMGIPCISTDCAGSNEIIVDRENGILIPRGSEEDLVKSINVLINDNNLRKKLSKSAQLTAEFFSSSSVVKKWEKIINEN